MNDEFTGEVIYVDVRTVGDTTYFSQRYPHPENSKKEVVVTKFSMVNLDGEEKEAGLQSHYWVRGEAVGETVNVPSLEEIRKNREARDKNPSSLPLVDGSIPCKEYADEYSRKIRSEMIKKGMLR